MKKIFMAAGLAFGIISCGSQSNEAAQTSDSTNVMDANKAPMQQDTGGLNSNASYAPTDTSGRSGDDSVKGSSPASRSTTPGNTPKRKAQ